MFNWLKNFLGIKPSHPPGNVIDVGDTIGFIYGSYYIEGIVTAILPLNEDRNNVKYTVKITRDDAPHICFSNWVGQTKVIDLSYSHWTIIKKYNVTEIPVHVDISFEKGGKLKL